MPHSIEETGIDLLIDHLRNTGHAVKRLRGTFDVEVDGQRAEVKTKGKCFNDMDFISLTQNQWNAAKTQEFDIYVVCNIKLNAPEFFKVPSRALLAKKPRIVISYEYDKNVLKDAIERI
jgi:hypothetical protein